MSDGDIRLMGILFAGCFSGLSAVHGKRFFSRLHLRQLLQLGTQPPGVCQDNESPDESPDGDNQVNGWTDTCCSYDQEYAQDDLKNPQDEAAPSEAPREVIRSETTEDMQQTSQQHDEAD